MSQPPQREWRRGGSPASPGVTAAAEHLAAHYPGPVRVLSGLRLVDASTGQWLPLDLVALTERAAVVGVEVRPSAGADAAAPQAAALAVARLQQQRGISPALPVYACWLGAAPPEGYAGGAPALADPQAVRMFVEQASQQPGLVAAPGAAGALAEQLLAADVGPVSAAPAAAAPVAQPPAGPTVAAAPRVPARPGVDPVRQVLRDLRDLPAHLDASLREYIRQPLPWRRGQPVRPADVREHLEAAMLDRNNVLEDARFASIVPNEFFVELSPDNYERHYRLIERRVVDQWLTQLAQAVQTTNQRQGREQYQFGGELRIHVSPAVDLAIDQVRVRCRIVPDPEPEPAAGGCLELLSTGQRWELPAGSTIVGRGEAADIVLDAGRTDARTLISSRHLTLQVDERGQVWAYDGVPGGRPSTNGTFVNGQRLTQDGRVLADGDVLVLAPLNPNQPRPDAPGTIALRYNARCEGPGRP